MSDVATGAATSPSSARMLTTLVRLRDALQRAALPLEIPGVEERRVARVEMIDQLEDYVLPRLVQIDAPLLTVVGGSTGAGKSTLVNSLVGATVSASGVLRPTSELTSVDLPAPVEPPTTASSGASIVIRRGMT